jgi:plasmid stability protein
MKNITLSIEDDLLKAGREYARKHRLSFNALVRKLIRQTVISENTSWLDETFAMMDNLEISDKPEKWTRDELYRG